MSAFTYNHYVPEWYQRKFLPLNQGKFHYLDLQPDVVTTSTGYRYTRKALLNWGPPSCFAQDDLYSTHWGIYKNTDIEKFFFGEVDREGREALEFFIDFQIRNGMHKAFRNLVRYMSIQKLRTPKGLGWLKKNFETKGSNQTLLLLQRIQYMFAATWTDAVWQVADATNSPTKFIISDHPVTVYNRARFPGSAVCRGFGDPDIREVATHTYFPLSLEKILILTNLSWVRDPYQKETNPHPNQEFFRTTLFKSTDLQVGRMLDQNEVRQINYITKMRALRYVAAADQDWLYPEEHLDFLNWKKFGDGLLFMPDPRSIYMGGQVVIGYKDGSSDAFGEYGHRPGQAGYKSQRREARESRSLERFKSEFALMQGREWRGWPIDHFGKSGPQVDSEDYFNDRISEIKDKKWLRRFRHAD